MTRTEYSFRPLPPVSSISSEAISFLNAKLSTEEDLYDEAPTLVSSLRTQSQTLDQSLIDLNSQLKQLLADYASVSNRIGPLFSDINSKISELRTSTLSPTSPEGSERILGEELPALAKEVARVEAVRKYAETALKLDTLVGDIEDAVSLTVNRNLRRHHSRNTSEDAHVGAIKTLKLTEDILCSITKTNPQWTKLVSAVDHRVDRALAIFRPQAIADHRALLTSLGWPPPLSSLSSSSLDMKKSGDVYNPLFTAQGELKYQYCKSFLALCSLQELQRQRKCRQLAGLKQEIALHQPLWAIEELVNPISITSQRHFIKWIDKPEFIFALIYKITRDYVDSMDELLQPLVDEALLSGYSCREEWVSAMVSSLSTYLAKEILPSHVSQLEEERVTGTSSQARTSWLHLIDLMISFDKRVRSLVAQSGILLSVSDGDHEKISSLSVFCDRPDWLDVWTEVELTDIMDKLKPEMEDERNWSSKGPKDSLLSGQEDNRSPSISSVFLRYLSYVIDRCRSVPTISLRSRFMTLTCVPIIQKFLDCLLLRCLEAEGLTALTDNDALVKVTSSINAAKHFVSVLKEWCEDVFFLEMGLNHIEEVETSNFDKSSGMSLDMLGDNNFDKEISKLEKFRLEWIDKLSTVVLRGFDSSCRDYLKNRKQWQEKGEEGWVSRSFVGALEYLQAKLSLLEENLNQVDFVRVWRTLASGIDQFIYSGIFTSNVKFHDGGVEKLANDLAVLFGVFNSWCLRPEGFFPKVSEGLKLLKMEKRQLQSSLAGGERWLKDNKITHLTISEAEKIVKNRVHTS